MARLAIFLVAVMSVFLVQSASAFYEKNANVADLKADTFANTVIASPKVWVVEFYAPWCTLEY